VEFMRRLSKVVNIVPVIAKADTLTLEERDNFKQTVRRSKCLEESGAFFFYEAGLHTWLRFISSSPHTCKNLKQVFLSSKYMEDE